MSRTRQSPNEIDLWYFPIKTTNTSNHIENTESTVGIHFKATDMGLKTRTEREVLSGRVIQSSTVNVYKTKDNTIKFSKEHMGGNIALIPNPSRKDLSSIVNIKSKPQNKRGARHNTDRVVEYIIEVS